MILCISALSVVTSPFSFLIVLIWFFLFFLISLAECFFSLFIFSKNQLVVSLTISIVFLVSVGFIVILIFLNSFLLLTLVFVSYFSIPLNVYLHSLFSIFISCRSPVSLWTSFTVSIFIYLQVFLVPLDLFINTLIVYKHVIYCLCGYFFFQYFL